MGRPQIRQEHIKANGGVEGWGNHIKHCVQVSVNGRVPEVTVGTVLFSLGKSGSSVASMSVSIEIPKESSEFNKKYRMCDGRGMVVRFMQTVVF